MTEKQVYIREVKELCEGLRKIRGVENIILTTRDGYPISICGLWTSKRDVFDMCSITAALNTAISHSHRQGSPLIYQGEELVEDTYIFNYYFNTGAKCGYEANVDRTASLNIATLALERGLVSETTLSTQPQISRAGGDVSRPVWLGEGVRWHRYPSESKLPSLDGRS